jgi:hypothetical protein
MVTNPLATAKAKATAAAAAIVAAATSPSPPPLPAPPPPGYPTAETPHQPHARAPKAEGLYEVHLLTGKSGTDAFVTLEVFGEHGSSGARVLEHSKTHYTKFQPGQTDVFLLSGVGNLGRLTHVNVCIFARDPTIPAVRSDRSPKRSLRWFLESVRVTPGGCGAVESDGDDELQGFGGAVVDTVLAGGTTASVDGEAVFPCNRWLSKSDGDGLTTRTLPLIKVQYIVEVKTGTIKGAGTDARVYVALHGKHGLTSGIRKLADSETFNDMFVTGHVDRFRIDSVDLGPLEKVVIGHNAGGKSDNTWFCEEVVVQVPAAGTIYKFPCFLWLGKGKKADGMLERTLFHTDPNGGVVEVEMCDTYVCTVRTSGVSNAGTNAKVLAIFTGTDGATEEIELTNKQNNFGKGQVDVFYLELPRRIGTLTKMRIRKESGGLGSAWHLQSVEMNYLRTNRIDLFTVNQWVSSKELSGYGARFAVMQNLLFALEECHHRYYTPVLSLSVRLNCS